MIKKLLPLAGVIAVPVLLAVAGGALTSDDAPPNISNEPAVTDRELPRAPLSDGQGMLIDAHAPGPSPTHTGRSTRPSPG